MPKSDKTLPDGKTIDQYLPWTFMRKYTQHDVSRSNPIYFLNVTCKICKPSGRQHRKNSRWPWIWWWAFRYNTGSIRHRKIDKLGCIEIERHLQEPHMIWREHLRREHLTDQGWPLRGNKKGSSNRERPPSEQSCINTAIGWFPPREDVVLLAGDKRGGQRHRKPK